MIRPVDTFEAIIIGGGIAGVSIAFHLAERGCKVAVLERKFVAAAATGRSSGMVRMHYDLETESRLAWAERFEAHAGEKLDHGRNSSQAVQCFDSRRGAGIREAER